MANRNWRWGTLVVVLAAVLFGLSYFGRVREPLLELVAPAKMLPGAKFGFPGDTAFGERVVKNSPFALILHHSEYSNANANALEAVRSWAASEFHQDPRFLHPVILPKPVASSTFLNATAYNVLAVPYYVSAQAIGGFLSSRIDTFSTSPAFQSFAADYYDLLGKDGEAAVLLARYQSERAKAAINPFLSLLYFILAFAFSPVVTRPFRKIALAWRAPFGPEGASAAAVFSYFLTCLSTFYFSQAVLVESSAAQSILAGITCGALALYALLPVQIIVDEKEVLTLRHTMSNRRLLVFSWVVLTLFCVQFLTWLKQGVLTDPDPLTLLICGFSGDFLHEPMAVKHFLATAIGLAWSVSFAFMLRTLARRGSESTKEIQKKLAALNLPGVGSVK
ncbi:MAG: hypothetical protein JST01_16005 [Cyanobacteria bacterium SZAS TMP-1]|nr:hypothetical protein [Cyanobacteria bacterium SZAS TMP-1]